MYCKDCKNSEPYEWAKYDPPEGQGYLMCNKIDDSADLSRDGWHDDESSIIPMITHLLQLDRCSVVFILSYDSHETTKNISLSILW